MDMHSSDDWLSNVVSEQDQNSQVLIANPEIRSSGLAGSTVELSAPSVPPKKQSDVIEKQPKTQPDISPTHDVVSDATSAPTLMTPTKKNAAGSLRKYLVISMLGAIVAGGAFKVFHRPTPIVLQPADSGTEATDTTTAEIKTDEPQTTVVQTVTESDAKVEAEVPAKPETHEPVAVVTESSVTSETRVEAAHSENQPSRTDAVEHPAKPADGVQTTVTVPVENLPTIVRPATGPRLIATLPHHGNVLSLAFDRDGQSIFTSTTGDQLAHQWDLQSQTEIRTFRGHSDWVYSVVVAPTSSGNAEQILTASRDLTARIWNVKTGELIRTIKTTKPLVSAVYSSDGRNIFTSTLTSGYHPAPLMITGWNTESGQLVGEIVPVGVTCVILSPLQNQALVGFDGGSAGIFPIVDDKISMKSTSTFVPSTQQPGSTTANEDGEESVSELLRRYPSPEISGLMPYPWLGRMANGGRAVMCLAFSSDGERVVVGHANGKARIYRQGLPNESCLLVGHQSVILAVAFSPNGDRIVTGSADQTARIWDAVSGKELCRLEGHTGVVSAVSFSPDGKRVATGSTDKTVRIWDIDAELH